jgi:hypothetical protein
MRRRLVVFAQSGGQGLPIPDAGEAKQVSFITMQRCGPGGSPFVEHARNGDTDTSRRGAENLIQKCILNQENTFRTFHTKARRSPRDCIPGHFFASFATFA